MVKARETEINHANLYLTSLKNRIEDLEKKGLYIVVHKSVIMPKVNGQIYEPSDLTWMSPSFYAEYTNDVKKAQINRAQPL